MSAAPESSPPRCRLDDYTDYRQFMAETLDAQRGRSALAAYLGVSKSMLTAIISYDRRVHPTLVSRIADYFELDEAERSVFAALVDLDNDSARARRSALATLEARRRFVAAARATDDATVLALARWQVGAVHSLAECAGFRADPAWIAATLTPNVTVEEAQEAVRTLVELGLLEVGADGSARVLQSDIATPHDVGRGARSMAMATLQREVLRFAGEALGRYRGNERHSSVAMFAMPEERFAATRVRLRELEQEVVDLGTGLAKGPPNRIYALSVQLFPLSDYTDAATVGDPAPSDGGG